MTPVQPMTREELIEFAALDAFGLLSEYEASLYTRSFHHAPAGVQDEVLTLQAELVGDATLFDAEEPPSSLRERVLSAVAAAIERETHELRPLATIGQRRLSAARSSGRARHTRSGTVWRAAALVMMAATLVMGYFWAESRSQSDRIVAAVLHLDAENELSELIGPGFKEFVNNPNCERRVMLPTTNGNGAVAIVFVNRLTNEAFVLAMGLPDGVDSTFEIAKDDGHTAKLGTLTGDGTLAVLRLDAAAAVAITSATLQISVEGLGAVLTT